MIERFIPCLLDSRQECMSSCAMHQVANARLLFAEKHRNVYEGEVIIADLSDKSEFTIAQNIGTNMIKLDQSRQLYKCEKFATKGVSFE